MRGSAAFRAAVAPGGVLAGPWVKNDLWRRARAVPSLDLRFADDKSLIDATTGQSLVTFTRASSGTYVGSDGLIKTATTNLLLGSEEFDNAYWTKNNSCTITANADVAPNGTITADQFNGAALSSTGVYTFPATTSSLVYTFSVYVKNVSNATTLRLGVESSPVNAFVTFNATTGAITSAAANVTSSSVSNVGNGWYRVALTYTSTGTSAGVVIYSMSGSATTWLTWGAQLEQSSTVGEYIPTTSVINSAPRFDHNPTTGESLGLLVEEQRTNLLLQSEDLLTTWTANDGLVRTANQTVSPAGSVTADLLASGVTQIGYLEQPNASSNQFVSGTTYTYSVYLKKANTSTCLTLLFGTTFNSGGGNPVATWNLDTGVPAFTNGATGSMTAVGNGWYRCVMTDTATQTHTQNQQWLRMPSTSGDVYAWGAQLEAGAFPTSYIPTTTATATRSADVASITGTNFSSWYRQDEGTVFADVNTAPVANIAQAVFDLSEGAGSERIFQRRDTGGFVVTAITDNGVVQGDFGSVSVVASGRARSGLAYRLNDFEAAVNGSSSGTDTSATVPAPDRIHIGQNFASGQVINGTIRRLTFWPQRLPNSTLQEVTR